MKSKVEQPDSPPVFELEVGQEIVEVRLDGEGIHFCHPDGDAHEGHIAWEVAIALSLLPEQMKRGAISAA